MRDGFAAASFVQNSDVPERQPATSAAAWLGDDSGDACSQPTGTTVSQCAYTSYLSTPSPASPASPASPSQDLAQDLTQDPTNPSVLHSTSVAFGDIRQACDDDRLSDRGDVIVQSAEQAGGSPNTIPQTWLSGSTGSDNESTPTENHIANDAHSPISMSGEPNHSFCAPGRAPSASTPCNQPPFQSAASAAADAIISAAALQTVGTLERELAISRQESVNLRLMLNAERQRPRSELGRDASPSMSRGSSVAGGASPEAPECVRSLRRELDSARTESRDLRRQLAVFAQAHAESLGLPTNGSMAEKSPGSDSMLLPLCTAAHASVLAVDGLREHVYSLQRLFETGFPPTDESVRQTWCYARSLAIANAHWAAAVRSETDVWPSDSEERCDKAPWARIVSAASGAQPAARHIVARLLAVRAKPHPTKAQVV